MTAAAGGTKRTRGSLMSSSVAAHRPGSISGDPLEERGAVRSRLRPTVEGLAWIGVAMVLIWQAWARGVNLIALFGCLLAAMWVLNLIPVLFRWGMKRIEVRRRTAEHVFAGSYVPVDLELINTGARAQAGLRVEEAGRGSHKRFFVPRLAAQGSHRCRMHREFTRRGRYRWPEIRISSGLPFGLFRRTVRIDSGQEIIVLPQLGRLQRQEFRRLLQQRPEPLLQRRPPTRKHPASQNEFHGLREYRSGDSFRWIHWRTTARLGELMVREFSEPPLENLTVVLDPWLSETPPAGEPGASVPALSDEAENLELAIRLAATICWEWCRLPGSLLALVVADPALPIQVIDNNRQHVFRLLRTLALVQGGPSNASDAALAKLRRAELPRGPCVLITAGSNEWTGLIESTLRRPAVVIDIAAGGWENYFDPAMEPPELTVETNGGPA